LGLRGDMVWLKKESGVAFSSGDTTAVGAREKR
jgi:hypothetical protein